MKRPSRLRLRILLAAFALTFVTALLFSVGLFSALEYAEWVLFDKHIESDISTFIRQYGADPNTAVLPRDNFQAFVTLHDEQGALPVYLRDLDEDEDEVVLDGREYHLDVRREGDTTFYFLFDETAFEAFDQLLSVFVPVAIFLICAISLALGFVFSNRIIRPVTALARRVNQFEGVSDAPAGPASKSDDEIEVLAQAIDGFQKRVSELLSREREFSSDVSHELRTPLMGIQAAADNLLIDGAKQDRIDELSRRIQKRCGQMRALVDALLSLARDPHSLENDFQKLRLADIVRDQVDAAAPHMEGRGVTIRMMENGDPVVFTTAAILNVVIGNILRNAILHSNSREIHIHLTPRGLCIKDFGQGVSADLRDKIFERYSSAGNDRGRDLGIGLSLVLRLCRHFNWTVSFDSSTGLGTAITIDFGPSIRQSGQE